MGIPTGLSLTNKAWWEADTTVYSDAGTTPAVNNATVQQWNDQVSGITLTQATGGNRPTFKTAQLNSLPAVQFVSASTTYLSQTSIAQAQPLTIVWVGKITGPVNGAYLYDATASTPRITAGLDLNATASYKMGIFAGGTLLQSSVNHDLTAYHLEIHVFTGSSSFAMIDGLPEVSGSAQGVNPGTAAMASFRIGAQFGASSPSDNLTCAMGIFGGAATAKDIVSLGNQLGAKYALTSIPTPSAGNGVNPTVLTITSDGTTPISGAMCYVTSDSAGLIPVTGALASNASGNVTFNLTTGVTYYLTAKASGSPEKLADNTAFVA